MKRRSLRRLQEAVLQWGNITSMWRVLTRIVQRIEASLDTADFVFIDEIGKMELLSKNFETFIEHVFSLDKPVVAVVHRNFVSRYRSKGSVFVLTRNSFEQ